MPTVPVHFHEEIGIPDVVGQSYFHIVSSHKWPMLLINRNGFPNFIILDEAMGHITMIKSHDFEWMPGDGLNV